MHLAEGGVLWHPCEGGFSLAEGSGFVEGWREEVSKDGEGWLGIDEGRKDRVPTPREVRTKTTSQLGLTPLGPQGLGRRYA